MTDAERDALVVAFLPLARRMARDQAMRRPRIRHQWYSDANLGLARAGREFDAARNRAGIKGFAEVARLHIRSQFNATRKAERPKGYRVRADGSRPVGTPAIAGYDDVFGDGEHERAQAPPSREPGPDARLLEAERETDLARWLGRLKPEEARLVRSVYLEGRTIAAIAAEEGIKPRATRTRVEKALARLRIVAVQDQEHPR